MNKRLRVSPKAMKNKTFVFSICDNVSTAASRRRVLPAKNESIMCKKKFLTLLTCAIVPNEQSVSQVSDVCDDLYIFNEDKHYKNSISFQTCLENLNNFKLLFNHSFNEGVVNG